MKNAKLLVIALIVVIIFSVSAVSAAENTFNATSSDLTQVPHEQVVSVAEPTSVQEVETIDLETSDDEGNEMKLDSDGILIGLPIHGRMMIPFWEVHLKKIF